MPGFVITGVTRGLDRAMVKEFARLGHLVLACELLVILEVVF